VEILVGTRLAKDWGCSVALVFSLRGFVDEMQTLWNKKGIAYDS